MVRKFRNQVIVVGICLFQLASLSFAESVPGEFVIKFKNTPVSNTVQKRLAVRKKLNAVIKKELPLIGAQVIVGANGKEIDQTYAKELLASGAVEYIEPNFIYHASAVANDPKGSDLWGLKNVGQQGGTSGVDIGATTAWDQFTGGDESVVAVLDTGVNYLHEDLASNIWTNSLEIPNNGIDDDANGVVDDFYGYNASLKNGDPLDDNGHGTHCAGTIAAIGNNSIGVVGVNWKAKVMPLKFLNSAGSGTLDNAIDALEYAIKQKRAGVNLRVISNSWGGDEASAALEDAVKVANSEGILFVAAAGNASSDNDSIPTYPANINEPNVISVAAIDSNGNLASFSNYGAASVQVAAPGVNIWSTWLNNGYKSLSGTSMAAPHVAGVATLLINKEPNLTVTELRTRLVQTIQPLDSLRGLVSTSGLINASNALSNTVAPQPPPERVPGYVDTSSSPKDSNDTGSVILSADDGYVEVNLPFSFPFYLEKFSRLAVSSNGRVIPLKATDPMPTAADFSNVPLPGISVYHDDYIPAPNGGVSLKSDETSVTLTWNVIPFAFRNSSSSEVQVKFQLIINQSGVLELNFLDSSVGNSSFDAGGSATVGVFPIPGIRGDRLVLTNNTSNVRFSSGKGVTLSPKKLIPRSDVDGDGISDPVFFNQKRGGFRALLSTGHYEAPLSVSLGMKKDQPFICDIDGDKRSDFLVYRKSDKTWYFKASGRKYAKLRAVPWGEKNSSPLVGDFDGDGKCDLVSVDEKTKEADVLLSSGGLDYKGASKNKKGTKATVKGVSKFNELLVGDFNGDGKESLANATNELKISAVKVSSRTLSCDLNSDGRSESISVSLSSGALFWSGGSIGSPIQYGQNGDRPNCSNDYDGDGAGDISVFRPSSRELFIRKSFDGEELKISPNKDEQLVS